MKAKGVTLIECVVTILILSILSIIILDFYSFNIDLSDKLLNSNNDIMNSNIAMDFIIKKIRENEIYPINKNNNGVLEVFKTKNNELLYVKNNILRFLTDSQQIAPDIKAVFVEDKGKNMYSVSMETVEGIKFFTYVGKKR